MKSNYIQPSVETVDMIASNVLQAESKFDLNIGGGSTTIPPSQGL